MLAADATSVLAHIVSFKRRHLDVVSDCCKHTMIMFVIKFLNLFAFVANRPE